MLIQVPQPSIPGEKVVLVDYVNDQLVSRDCLYASVTAPFLTYIEVEVDGVIIDGVWIAPGSSHSWWTQAGGKLLGRHGLAPGERLIVRATGQCAFRLDWTDE